MKKAKFDVYEFVNETITKQLGKIKAGKSHYLIKSNFGAPYNPLSKKVYTGVNATLLILQALEFNYTVGAWATFKQIVNAGGTIKKGSKADKIVFYKMTYYIDGKKVSEVKAKAYYNKYAKNPIALKKLTKKAVLRYYNVFHLSKVDGLDVALLNEFNPNELLNFTTNNKAKELVFNTDARVLHTAAACGSYTYGSDEITMPFKEIFKSSEAYYSTLLHELSHWTGADQRLDRLKNNNSLEDIAYEELIAEFSAAYLCVICGIDNQIQSNTQYIDSWLNAVKDNKYFLTRAMSAAKKASDYILTFTKELAPVEA